MVFVMKTVIILTSIAMVNLTTLIMEIAAPRKLIETLFTIMDSIAINL